MEDTPPNNEDKIPRPGNYSDLQVFNKIISARYCSSLHVSLVIRVSIKNLRQLTTLYTKGQGQRYEKKSLLFTRLWMVKYNDTPGSTLHAA